MTTLSGDLVTEVFEGPYSHAKKWHEDLQLVARDRGSEPGEVYFSTRLVQNAPKPMEKTTSWALSR